MLSLFHLLSQVVGVPVVLLVVTTGYQVVAMVVVLVALVVEMPQEVIRWHFWLLVDFIHLILVPLANHTSPHLIMSRTG
jgi:hypothetical protein